LLRQANPKHLGSILHHHRRHSEDSSQKGVKTITFREISERSPKLAQSIVLELALKCKEANRGEQW
jgi:hypothetical protein